MDLTLRTEFFSMRARSMHFLFLVIFLLAFLPSPHTTAASLPVVSRQDTISAGIWRAELIRKDGHKIVFNFQVSDSSGKMIIYILNGSERLLVDNIRKKDDSIFIDMPFFDSHFSLYVINDHSIEGNWIKISGDRRVVVPFRAFLNRSGRFPVLHPASFDISGRWSVLFRGETDTTLAVGEFKQSGAQVRGTFLTTTGDYRFLEGIVDADTLRLSTFDGGHAYSFVSYIQDPTTMKGLFYSGASSVENWTAFKNETARLPDEYSLTKLKDSVNARLHFKFPDLRGEMVSLTDPEFKNKVVIIQILGSWCPNCMDETRFLSPWYLQNKTRGIEIVGLAYERTSSFSESKRLLQPFISRFHVTYPILVTGVTTGDSLRTEKTLPEITQIVGFPTTIFVDKKGNVRKIHTGFNGPGTGEHYIIFQKEFNELINRLLSE